MDEQLSSGSPQTLIRSTYRTQIANQSRLITITWCKSLLLHGLSVSVDGPSGLDHYECKLELKPWCFWRKQGSKEIEVNGHVIGIFWDLRGVKFNREVEPQCGYYVAIVCKEEVVLVVGDMKKDAFRRTRCRPALDDPILVSRKEHVFGKRRFLTKGKFNEKGKFCEVFVECKCRGENEYSMEIGIDGELVIEVKHLEWKFRGNEKIRVKEGKIDVYWDVHDWLFGSGPRHGMFLFKPSSSSSSSSSIHSDYPICEGVIEEDGVSDDASNFCLFLCAWKVE